MFAAGAYFALSATPLYTATATIKIEPQNPRVTGVGELQPLGLSGEYDYHKTQFALLQSRALAARVITELGLEANKTFTDADDRESESGAPCEVMDVLAAALFFVVCSSAF